MTDTPATAQPPTRLDRVKGFIGDLARPFAIIVTSAGAAIATVIIAQKVDNGNDGGVFIGAVFVGVGAIYIGKAVEVWKANKAAAEVEIAKATTEPKP